MESNHHKRDQECFHFSLSLSVLISPEEAKCYLGRFGLLKQDNLNKNTKLEVRVQKEDMLIHRQKQCVISPNLEQVKFQHYYLKRITTSLAGTQKYVHFCN